MRSLSTILLCFAVGCGASNPSHGGGGGSGGTGGSGDTGGSGGSGGTGGSGGGTGAGGCSDAAKLIYTIDQDGTFSSFKPDQTDITKSVFTDLGKLNCNGSGGLYQPFSMSVDRNAVAWVEYVDQSGLGKNKLFQVSTANATCTATNFMGGQQGFNEFGMGFVSNSSGSTDETLFIAGGGTIGGASSLGTLDTTSLTITKLGSLTGDPELTGTGTAQLWGFFPDLTQNTMQAHVSQIDKMTGAESNQISLGSAAGMANAWAFAFYGGDFFVFLAKSNGATIVYHVTTTGLKDQLDTMTRHIVGAGVSTCAPTTPIG